VSLWPLNDRTWLAEAFDAVVRPAPRVVSTCVQAGCILHGTPGLEYLSDYGRPTERVTDAMWEAWDREGVIVIRRRFVSPCHCDEVA
jgi:hypothetical protein